MQVQDYAREYIKKGWQVVPLRPKSKSCKAKEWTRLKFQPEDFDKDDGIGIRSLGGIVVIDIDCQEALKVADDFLPRTKAVYGRKSKPRSKRIFYSEGFGKTLVYRDVGAEKDKATIIEIRSNHQDVAPPSFHPSGEQLFWPEATIGDSFKVQKEILTRSVRLLSTCVLLARYYNPPGNRHEWGLAISGLFKTLKITEAEAIKIFAHAGGMVGDQDTKDRVGCVRSTYDREDDDPTRGIPAVKELMARFEPFLKSLRAVWGTLYQDSEFVRNNKDQIAANNPDNILRALKKMEVVVHLDTFSHKLITNHRAEKEGEFRLLDDYLFLNLRFEINSKFRFLPSRELFFDVVRDACFNSPVHPVREYLDSLKWDGKRRLDGWLVTYGGAKASDYCTAVGSIVLIAAVRRALRPGCKFDELLILESQQGWNKSTALATLCPNPKWFSDDLPLGVDSKVMIERTLGKWIIEAAECVNLGRREDSHLKASLSRQVDGPVRLSYDRVSTEVPRSFIVIGTTNSKVYLHDSTGARRFWPIEVGRFDIVSLKRDRDQLWAEAYQREKQGASIRLDPSLYEHAEIQQGRRSNIDPWYTLLEENFVDESVKWRITLKEPWDMLGIPIAQRTESGAKRIAAVMQSLGFRKTTIRKGKDKPCKGWARESNQSEIGDEQES